MSKVMHGGKRPGAGRPKGAMNRRSEALAERLRELGVEPPKRFAKFGVAAENDGGRRQQ
jgi:hypothetical protein